VSDCAELVRLEVESFRDYYRAHRFTAEDFLRYLAKANTLAIVADTGGRLTGYALGPAPLTGHPRSARLDSIAVQPGTRARGLGSRLLARFLRDAKARGCRRVSLEVAVPNEAARRLFDRAGFRTLRTLPGYYGGTIDAVRLRASL
jgi:ribosomal-protein-alanine N-acetyltransferase